VIAEKKMGPAARNRPTKRWRLPRVVTAAAHWVLAMAVVLGIMHSGGRYFYCEAFGLLPFDPCAEASGKSHSESPWGMLSEHHVDCCEIVTLTGMPQAAQAAAPTIAPAAWVAIIPALSLEGPADATDPSRVDRAHERWRPPPRASKDVRARLMVFLI
jgi:hypothetical protein